jgi:hypothetical protein
MFVLSSPELFERWEGRRSRKRSYANETWKKSIVETVSPGDAQDNAARQRRDRCSEQLDIYIRYSQRDEWVDGGLMPGTPAARKLNA